MGSPDSTKLQAEAEGLLRTAIRLMPQSAEAHYLLAQLALQRNRLQDAQEELARSVQADPDRSKTHFSMSIVERRMGRTADADLEFARYQELKLREENGGTSARKAANP